jgi:hypothetical protein
MFYKLTFPVDHGITMKELQNTKGLFTKQMIDQSLEKYGMNR